MEPVAYIAHDGAAVALAASGVAQPAVLQANPVAVVLNTVCGHAVIGIVDERGACPVEPVAVATAHLRRQSQLLVVCAAEDLHAAAQRLRGYVVGIETQHAAYGIAAIEQGRRTLDDLSAIDRKLVYLQSVVVAPLLSFVLDTILAHHHAVVAQTAYGGLRLP